MAKRLIIFGVGRFAQLLKYYFDHDTEYNVCAFTLDGAHCDGNDVLGCPLIPFEEVASRFPPDNCDMFIGLGYTQMNRLREQKCDQAKRMGYSLASYVSSRANVSDAATLGRNCLVFEDATVQPFAEIQDGVFIWGGAYVSHHCKIGAYAFLSAEVSLGGESEIGHHAFLGLNAIVRDKIRVGPGSLLGPGSIVLAETEENSVHIVGHSPASKIGADRYLKMLEL